MSTIDAGPIRSTTGQPDSPFCYPGLDFGGHLNCWPGTDPSHPTGCFLIQSPGFTVLVTPALACPIPGRLRPRRLAGDRGTAEFRS